MFEENVILNRYSNYKIGGRARYFYIARSIEDLERAIGEARRIKAPIFILGGGTNLLISDEGFAGLVLKQNVQTLEAEGEQVRVGAGVLMSELLNFAAERGLAGLEWAGGLPGTVGGAIRGNAGAFGGETKDIVAEITSLDVSGSQPKLIRRANPEARFGYRTSIYKQEDGKEIIVEATFNLKKGDAGIIRAGMDDKIRYRLERHPLDYPNIGSTFKNVDLKLAPEKVRLEVAHAVKKDPFPLIPTAYLLSEAGLKGVSYGGAMFSPKHPNFIVNVMEARATDVKKLIDLAKATVSEKFEIELEEEIIYVK